MPNRLHRFVVAGYVVMPEHLHLLLGEPERGNPSKVMQAIKQGFARRLLRKRPLVPTPGRAAYGTRRRRTDISGRRDSMTL